MHGKPTYKKENGSAPYKSNFSPAAGVSAYNRSQEPSSLRLVPTELISVFKKPVLLCFNQEVIVRSPLIVLLFLTLLAFS